jgi:hypothetical protein
MKNNIMYVLILITIVSCQIAFSSDLIITGALSTVSPSDEQEIFLDIGLKNIGLNSTENSVFSLLINWGDNKTSLEYVNKIFSVNETYTKSLSKSHQYASAGVYDINIISDYENNIAEENESNNVYTSQITVNQQTSYDITNTNSITDSVQFTSEVEIGGSKSESFSITNAASANKNFNVYVTYSNLVNGSVSLTPSKTSETVSLSTVGQTQNIDVSYSGFDERLYSKTTVFKGTITLEFNQTSDGPKITRTIPVTLTVIGETSPQGISVNPLGISDTLTINDTLTSVSKLSYLFNITNLGVYNKDLSVLVNATDLVYSSNNAIKLAFDDLYSQSYVINNNSTQSIPFRFNSNSDVVNNPGTYTASLSFTTEYGTVNRDISLTINPASVNNNNQNSSNSTIIQNNTSNQNSNPGNKLRIEIVRIYVNGQSEGNDETIGNRNDIRFGDEIEITFKVINEFSDDNENNTFEYLSYTFESDDLDIDDLEEEEIDDEVDAGDDSKSTVIFFKVPNADEFDVSEIKNSFELTLFVEGEDGLGRTHSDEVTFDLELHQENHDLIVSEIDFSPVTLDCSSDMITIEGYVKNFGTRDERDVQLKIYSSDLDLNRILTLEDIDTEDDEKFRYVHGFDAVELNKQSITIYFETRSDSASPQVFEKTINYNSCIIDNNEEETTNTNQNTNTQNNQGSTVKIDAEKDGKSFVTAEETLIENQIKEPLFKPSTILLAVLFVFLLILVIGMVSYRYLMSIEPEKKEDVKAKEDIEDNEK